MTILHIRHLLECHDLGRQIFQAVNEWLTEAGILVKEGSLMDATIIEAPNSTKNRAGERYPEMHQTKKGDRWHFGLKVHIGVDAKSCLTHSFTTTPANEHDLNQVGKLLHGDEEYVFADTGYRGIEKRDDLKD